MQPDQPEAQSVAAAAAAGDRVGELAAMRRRIARAIDDEGTPARDLAALTRRQIEIGKEIESLQAQEEEEATHGGVSEDEAFDPDEV
ncbi:hypothetical protein NQ036_03700 [Brevibacterium sp. 91QC2O2]|uniref:hypothetical protein n=1 Tax=Brevibacterium TaxID=1696 RepID=UPI00211CAC5F|nr:MULTISPECIES: hypothetical protein [unclassified Brevibacterium]MCQ9367351.1 hypothetical protein [Brevibacterium sp. 91QC2O2]MCQ9384636.1 hypothetical protein [Brevibacterium sp. 68QC2CO]